jgi:long-chain fatty acid transport protein
VATLHRFSGAFLLVFLSSGTVFGQFGAMMTGVGPINRSMGGAATAAPLDTLGALYWNPATITALPNSTDFGLELLVPHSTLSSSVNAGALGAGVPPIRLAGTSHSSAAVFPMPEFGLVFRPQDSAVTYGLGVLSVGGFSTNFPGSVSNPILMAPPPAGLGLGPITAQYQLMQIVPTISFQVTDQLSIGVSPTVDLAGLSADPGVFASPDNASGNGFATYPALTHGSYTWGAGVQAGAYYVTEYDWQFGASIKSPQWFQNFEYNAKNQIGGARSVAIPIDAPLIASIGTAYSGVERMLFAVDARYLDYRNTRGFAASGFGPTGAVNGLGWNSIYAMSAGVQYKVTDFTALRMGYSFSTNPISSDSTFFNIASPLVIQHGLSVGASRDITNTFKVSLTYCHFFENSVSGPFFSPLGGIPGTNVTTSASADCVIAGGSFKF